MLSKKDKEWILEVITAAVEKAVVEALTAEMEWEQKRDPKTGVPLATPRTVVENVFLPAYWAQHLKFHEGAYRGNQETLDKQANKFQGLAGQIEQLGEAFVKTEDLMIILERFVRLLAQTGIMARLEDIATIEIEGQETKKIALGG